jgi:hypothetical protein
MPEDTGARGFVAATWNTQPPPSALVGAKLTSHPPDQSRPPQKCQFFDSDVAFCGLVGFTQPSGWCEGGFACRMEK